MCSRALKSIGALIKREEGGGIASGSMGDFSSLLLYFYLMFSVVAVHLISSALDRSPSIGCA
jgi:hypothetical protein